MEGCGSHSCIIKKPEGMGTNSRCRCPEWKLHREIIKLRKQQNVMNMKVYVRYQDDGPAGICGQDTRTTSDWDQLHIFNDYERANELVRRIEHSTGRRNPRVTAMWQEEYGTEVFDHTGSK